MGKQRRPRPTLKEVIVEAFRKYSLGGWKRDHAGRKGK